MKSSHVCEHTCIYHLFHYHNSFKGEEYLSLCLSIRVCYFKSPKLYVLFLQSNLFKVCKCCKVNCVIVLIIECFSLLRLIFEKKSCTYMCVQLANVSGIYVFKIVSIWFQNISLWKLFITTGEITFVFGPENYMNKSFWE